MFRQHWGDLPIIPDTESGIAALEREQITKPRALEIEGAKLHQPVIKGTCYESQFTIDPLTRHTIQLLEHNRKLRTLVQGVQEQSVQDGMPRDLDVGPNALHTSSRPPLPQRPDVPSCITVEKPPALIYEPNQVSDFILGKGNEPPELPFSTIHQLLRKTVAVICAHAGYESSSEIVLDTLTSVAHQHFMKMCSLLRAAVDREALTGNTGFVDPVEDVFHQMGLGSVTILHHFYQSRMIGYHRHLMRTCEELEAEYVRFGSPQAPRHGQDSKTIRAPTEEASACEIKFPVLDDTESKVGIVGPDGATVGSGTCIVVQQSPPPLEELHGALQGMEGSSSLKEEAMKWLPPQVALRGRESTDATQSALDPDEIINVSDTPEPPSGSEMDQMSSNVSCDPLTLSPASVSMVQFCKPPKKKKKK